MTIFATSERLDSLRQFLQHTSAAAIASSLFAMAALAKEYGLRPPRSTFRTNGDFLILEFSPVVPGVPLMQLRVIGQWPGDCGRGSRKIIENVLVYACGGAIREGEVF
jgi:hypothetical protein